MSEITPNTPNPVREDAYKQQLAAKLGIDPQYIPGSPIWHSEEEIAALAEMFSNMAGGSSGGGVLVVHEVDGALDKTYKQIVDALHTNGVILEWALDSGKIEVYLVTDYGEVDGIYPIVFHTNSNETSQGGTYHYYFAESENGYPVNDD